MAAAINIAGNATTVIRSSPGPLVGVVVNTAGTTSTATVYDNTSAAGTKIATINTTVPGNFTYNCTCGVGLTVVTAGAAAADITVIVG